MGPNFCVPDRVSRANPDKHLLASRSVQRQRSTWHAVPRQTQAEKEGKRVLRCVSHCGLERKEKMVCFLGSRLFRALSFSRDLSSPT